MKNNKGITLIALVITIIVLLILAGVSIAMVTGQNGILNQASRAGSETQVAEAKELAGVQVSSAVAAAYEERYVKKNTAINTANIAGAITSGDLDITSENPSKYEITGTTITIKPLPESGVQITGTIQADGSIDWSDED